MITRFSVYDSPDRRPGDICEDPQGRWCRWQDAEPYITYCLGQGVTFPDAIHRARQTAPVGQLDSPDEGDDPDFRGDMLSHYTHLDDDDFERAQVVPYDCPGDWYPRHDEGGDMEEALGTERGPAVPE